ncbi:hypothetical protein BJX64DRAFT_15023 [Aspergillus heterothallicus]
MAYVNSRLTLGDWGVAFIEVCAIGTLTTVCASTGRSLSFQNNNLKELVHDFSHRLLSFEQTQSNHASFVGLISWLCRGIVSFHQVQQTCSSAAHPEIRILVDHISIFLFCLTILGVCGWLYYSTCLARSY